MKRLLLLLFLFSTPCWASWGHGGATCSTESEAAASTSLTCTVGTQNLEAGNVAVVVCATDNVTASDSATSDHTSVTDSTGANTYTKLGEFTEGSGGAAAGATVSLWFSKLTTQLASGSGTITCNFASVTDKAMHLVGEFTITGGNVVSQAGTTQTEASNGGDAGNLTISGLTSSEYLYVRGIATESNAAVSMTVTAGGYAAPDAPSDGCNNTATGGEATDMGACSEWDIKAASTGDSSNPALVDTTNDNASVYVALQETTPPAGAPRRRAIEWR